MAHMSFQMHKSTNELTWRCLCLAVILTVLLATSNTYLALKLGLLTSASIPAAILSMGILRFFKNSSILENNAVQTAASAGEAVAGGIAYTIPALIIIQYWHHFDYFTNTCIAFLGGVLGVLFSIPLRRVLVHDSRLHFPEAQAIAQILKSSDDRKSFMYLVRGGLIGALFEFLQDGAHLMASSWSKWIFIKQSVVGISLGFSATFIGAGYLIGQDMACSIFLGAVIAWFIALPWISVLQPLAMHADSAQTAMSLLWAHDLRYVGIGAMLCAGGWTFMQLAHPLLQRIRGSLRALPSIADTEHDLSGRFMVCILCLAGLGLYYLFHFILPLQRIGFSSQHSHWLVIASVGYVFVVGFFFSIITAYFSGMVGVTASPGSSIVIAGILFAAWLLLCALQLGVSLPLSAEQLTCVEAVTIIIASVVTGIAAIANDNSQDLKVGQLVGATPWKQQVMLILGVTVSALVIPPVMQLLFDVYGIAGVMPRANMDVARSLPAPPAALFAAITDAVFHHQLPWTMIRSGAGVIVGLLVINYALKAKLKQRLSILGVAVGMYLPLSSSVPLLLGGLIARQVRTGQQMGTLIACGLVAGAALMDVLLALIFSLSHTQNIFITWSPSWQPWSVGLSVLGVVCLARWIIHCTRDTHVPASVDEL
jgi:putative OPT family oligopeptide transporter